MNNLIYALLMLLGLSGCTAYFEGPSHKIESKTRLILITVHNSYEELSLDKRAPVVEGKTLKGFALYDKPVCEIHYVLNDYETLVHELKHCYYGNWHN